MVWPLLRRPKSTPPPSGPAIERREQLAARRRLLEYARQRQAQHLYDGPTFGRLP